MCRGSALHLSLLKVLTQVSVRPVFMCSSEVAVVDSTITPCVWWYDGWSPWAVGCVTSLGKQRSVPPLDALLSRDTRVWHEVCCWIRGPVPLSSSHQELQVSCYHGCHAVRLTDHPPHTQGNSWAGGRLASTWLMHILLFFCSERFPASSLKRWSGAALISS